MTRLEALRALYAAVKDGRRGMGWNTSASFGDGQASLDAVEAIDGSVDAALALIAATLPGYVWGRQWSGHMWVEAKDLPGRSERFYSDHPQPATALLLACIAAHIAIEERGE